MAGTYDYQKVMQTFFDMKNGLSDNYFNATQVLARARSKQKKQMFVSGQPIYFPVEMAGGTAEVYAEGATFNRQRKEVMHYGYVQPVSYRAELSITWGDEKRARSKEDMVGILKAKAANALKTLARTMTTDYLTGSTTGLIGLSTNVHAGTVTGTVCGISGNTYSWWRNKYFNENGALTLAGIMEAITMASDGADAPTVVITDKYLRAYAISTLLGIYERYTDGKAKQIDQLPVIYGIPIVVDAALESGDDTGGYMYFLDEDSYYLTVHSMDDLKRWPQVRPTDQFAFATDWTWEGAVICTNRRRQSVLYGATN